jgi:hypothetical protein
MTTDDLGFGGLLNLTPTESPSSTPTTPQTPPPPDPVMDEFRAMVLPSSQLPPEAMASKDLDFQTLGDSLKRFIRQLTESLGDAAKDLSSLEVRTFSTDDLTKLVGNPLKRELLDELQLRAFTHIAFDGDMQVVVPERGGKLDEATWQAHVAMVREAQANRAQFIGAMAEMATRLIQLFK